MLMWLALGSVLSLSCARQPSAKGGVLAPRGQVCRPIETIEPSFLAAGPVRVPMSHLSIHARLTEEWVNDRLDEQVPAILARERGRDVGAPGRATYEVKRGGARLAQKGSSVALELPIFADISVCKPFGSSCFRYGSCTPKFTIEARSSTQLDERFELSPPRLEPQTNEGCRIAIDVTPQLESMVDRELRSVKRELNRNWPNLSAYAEQLNALLAQPLNLWPEACAAFSDTSVRQQALRVASTKNGRSRALTGAVEVRARLYAAPTCLTKSDSPAALPSPETVRELTEESSLVLPEFVPLQRIEAELERHLEKGGPLSVSKVSLNDSGHMFVLLDLKQEYCGQVWVEASFRATAKADALAVDEVKIVGDYEKQLKRELAPVLSRLTSLQLKLAGGPWIATKQKEGVPSDIISPWQAELAPLDLRVHVGAVDIQPPEVTGAEDGIYVSYPISFVATLTNIDPDDAR